MFDILSAGMIIFFWAQIVLTSLFRVPKNLFPRFLNFIPCINFTNAFSTSSNFKSLGYNLGLTLTLCPLLAMVFLNISYYRHF